MTKYPPLITREEIEAVRKGNYPKPTYLKPTLLMTNVKEIKLE